MKTCCPELAIFLIGVTQDSVTVQTVLILIEVPRFLNIRSTFTDAGEDDEDGLAKIVYFLEG